MSQTKEVDVDMDDHLENMIRDIGSKSFQQAQVYDTLKSDVEIPLYLGCTSFTRLSTMLKLVNLKTKNEWINKSFIELLKLLKKCF